jgi:NadR type nicotinamide-nucleotide adenylyltransferase
MKRANTRKGVVVGDFCPLTNAHVHMIEFARHYVDELVIVVDEHEADAVQAELRVAWLEEQFPGVKVRRVKSAEWHKSDPADFGSQLLSGLRRILPKSLAGKFVFSLEARGKLLAEKLGAAYIPCDPALSGHATTEKEIRANPLKHWDALPRIVRPHYVRRVCVFGPESTGKSTLAKQLAKHFGTAYVPEYAQTYIATNGKDIDDNDMLAIARGQCALEDAVARESNGILFCDSDMVTSILWSGRLVGSVPDWLRREADKRHYDLYLLTHYDVPWVDDVHRYIPKESPAFFDRCLHELESRKRPFAQVLGNWDERFQVAVAAVEKMLKS